MSKAISGVDHVDGMLPIPQLFAYGFEHVLAMYAGAVAVHNHHRTNDELTY